MPQTSKGLQSHLDYWLYGIVKSTADLGNTRSFLRSVQEETIRKFLAVEHLSFTPDMDPVQLLRRYNEHLDARGILDADDIAYHRKGNGLTTTVGESCPNRTTCNWLHDDGVPPPCFRGIAMGELLRLVTGHTFDGKLSRFGVPCHLTFKRLRIQEAIDGN
jgi:hypothetical protein